MNQPPSDRPEAYIAALERELATYRTMLDCLPIMVWLKDANCRFLAANQRFADVAGLGSPSRIVGKTDQEIFPPEIAEHYWQADAQVMSSGQPVCQEEPCLEGWQETFRVPIFDSKGNVDGIAAYTLSISAQKQHEVSPQPTSTPEHHLLNFAACAPGIMYSYHYDHLLDRGSMPYVSPSIQNLCGLQAAELAEDITPFLAHIHPADRPRFDQLLANAIRNKAPYVIQLRLLDSTQGMRWVETRATPAVNDNGKTLWHGFMIDITEYKHIEQALANREREFRTLSENSPDIISRFDLGGHCTYSNARLTKSITDDTGRVVSKHRHTSPQQNSHIESAIAEQVSTSIKSVVDKSQAFETQIVCTCPLDQSPRYYHLHLLPEYMEDGRIASVLCVARDITEQKKSENALRQTQNRLWAVIDTIPDLVWMKDCNGVYLAANRAFERFLGAREQEIIGKTDYDFVCKEQADFFRQKDLAAIAANQICINEEVIQYHGEEQQRWLETRKVTVHDSNGDTLGVLGIGRDVSERKRLEAEIFRREAEFRTLVENASDMIARYDLNCRRVYCNPAVVNVSGICMAELLGKTPDECSPFPPAAAKAYTTLVHQVIDTKEAGKIEICWDKQGTPCWIDLRVTPEFGDSGQVISAFAVGRDISAQKQAEGRLRKSYELLRGLARHRENEYEKERKELARQIHEDLAQNLAALCMNISLLELNPATAPFTATLGTVRSIANRCIARTRDMVSMLHPTVLELGIAPALRWLANAFCKEIGFQATLELADDIVLDDQTTTFLFRASQEILINTALHAAASQITLSLKQQHGVCHLAIRDDGQGFDTNVPMPGNAFGLIDLDERIKRFGGRLSIESSPGKGTALEMRVPIKPVAPIRR